MRRMAAIVGAVVFLAGALHVPGSSTAAAATLMNPACRAPMRLQRTGPRATVRVMAVQQSGRVMVGTQHIRSAGLTDLAFVTEWDRLVGSHRQRFDFYGPHGHLYQTVSTRVVGDEHNDATIETFLPVAGTWITSHGLYGAWCVHLFLDDRPDPVARVTFVLVPPR